MGKIFTGLVAALLGFVLLVFWVGGTHAQSVRFSVNPGEEISFRCKNGVFSAPTRGRVVAWRCRATDEGPPEPQPPEPTPPPSTSCPAPNPYVAQTRKLQPGEQKPHVKVANGSTTVLTFNSRLFTGTGSINTGPWSSVGPDLTSITISECKGDFRTNVLSRSCWRSSNINSLRLTVGKTTSSVCGLKPNTDYVVNLSPMNIGNQKPTCKRAGNQPCEVVVQVATQ